MTPGGQSNLEVKIHYTSPKEGDTETLVIVIKFCLTMVTKKNFCKVENKIYVSYVHV